MCISRLCPRMRNFDAYGGNTFRFGQSASVATPDGRNACTRRSCLPRSAATVSRCSADSSASHQETPDIRVVIKYGHGESTSSYNRPSEICLGAEISGSRECYGLM